MASESPSPLNFCDSVEMRRSSGGNGEGCTTQHGVPWTLNSGGVRGVREGSQHSDHDPDPDPAEELAPTTTLWILMLVSAHKYRTADYTGYASPADHYPSALCN